MAFTDLMLLVLGMMLVTALPRIIPVTLLAGRNLPEWLITWLKYVPISILSAMLIVDVAWKNERVALGPSNLLVPVSVLGFLVAIKTRSLFGTVAVGMGALAVMRMAG